MWSQGKSNIILRLLLGFPLCEYLCRTLNFKIILCYNIIFYLKTDADINFETTTQKNILLIVFRTLRLSIKTHLTERQITI